MSAKIKITQTRQRDRRKPGSATTLKALGLNKMNRFERGRRHASIRGMVDKVAHLLRIEPAN